MQRLVWSTGLQGYRWNPTLKPIVTSIFATKIHGSRRKAYFLHGFWSVSRRDWLSKGLFHQQFFRGHHLVFDFLVLSERSWCPVKCPPKAQSDLVGFTEMSSQRHPEEVRQLPGGKMEGKNILPSEDVFFPAPHHTRENIKWNPFWGDQTTQTILLFLNDSP